VFELAIKTLLASGLGSVLGSMIVGRLQGGVDIRSVGSGNAGGTNALRTRGAAFAAWVILIDVGKGFIAARLLPVLYLPGVEAAAGLDRSWLAVACAIAAIVGHVYPVWYGFRGGKGAATAVGAVIGLAPVLLGPILIVWLLTLVTTGYVGLATMLAAVSAPVFVCIILRPVPVPVLAFAITIAVFIAFTHRENIDRMRHGTENRARRLWLLRPR
jgi:glycerol-3-phosphate acyltransferase PlsY